MGDTIADAINDNAPDDVEPDETPDDVKPDETPDDVEPEDKPAEDEPADKSEDDSEDEDDKDDSEGAPEGAYEFSLPDGYSINEADNEALQAIGKDLNLTQDQMQKAVDMLAAKQVRDLEALDAARAATDERNVEAAKSDPEIGKSYDEMISKAGALVFRAFQGQNESISDKDLGLLAEFQGELEKSSFNTAPVFLKFMNRLGDLVGRANDTIEDGNAPKPKRGDSRRDRAHRIYPSMAPKE